MSPPLPHFEFIQANSNAADLRLHILPTSRDEQQDVRLIVRPGDLLGRLSIQGDHVDVHSRGGEKLFQDCHSTFLSGQHQGSLALSVARIHIDGGRPQQGFGAQEEAHLDRPEKWSVPIRTCSVYTLQPSSRTEPEEKVGFLSLFLLFYFLLFGSTWQWPSHCQP